MHQSSTLLLFAALSIFSPATCAPTLISPLLNLLPPNIKPTLPIGAPAALPPLPNLLPSNKQPTLPADASSLQQPTTKLQLIALGVGRQNYTCASQSATPVAMGAVASLFDATAAMSNSGPVSQLATSQMTHIADQTSTASFDNGLGQQQIGQHFFDAIGVPNFDLYGVGKYLYAKKVGVVPAPADAYAGRDGAAAVPWLYLPNDGSGRSKGMGSVYRIETVGGSAASCAGTSAGQVITHDYAAEYWFYA